MLALVPIPILLLILLNPFDVRERVSSVFHPHGDTDSNEFRVICRRAGLRMIADHPWFGLGPEQVKAQLTNYIPADVPRPLPSGWYGHLHNIYLHYAAERGIPTMLALMWMLGKIIVRFSAGASALRTGGPGCAGDSAGRDRGDDRDAAGGLFRVESGGQRSVDSVSECSVVRLHRGGSNRRSRRWRVTEPLTGRQIVLAGGSGGLGSETARWLAAERVELIIGYQSNAGAAQAAAPSAKLVQGDLTIAADRARLLDAAPRMYGLVVLAGDPARVKDSSDLAAMMEHSNRVNYEGPVLLAREAAERMRASGTEGAIVLFATMQAVDVFPGIDGVCGCEGGADSGGEDSGEGVPRRRIFV